jgi:WD40 repeat protein
MDTGAARRYYACISFVIVICRGFDTRNNVRYAVGSNNERVIVYHAAAMGVVLQTSAATSIRSCRQSYFKGHKDDIMALALFTSSTLQTSLIATGQQGLGSLYVWNASDQKIVSSIATEQKSIHMLEFSADGRLLVSSLVYLGSLA